ncbi:SMC domain protein [Caldicellulosiruptor owensensis OL]|uniref:Nuclease SbcCD subunit C n=1 Tax=Caldicellulosiruptor owensensis (strain ATCC 700167 / DSM 13100 / OL) TaxID=632518 RepID=E4Q6T8_CALOW|nr:SMC family ATPase [Caldicellulosiruptor owensensis]ADQ04521.1 SMC domain protein [Caldicellulosiruptor owensensis OL]
MRPLFLRVENFKSYKDTQNEIDFSNIKVACIIGKNGNGKSSIAEAIAWALFGEFERLQTGKRGKVAETEYINSHRDYMQVEFEFELNKTIYKVVRRLDRKGKKYLSLFVKKGDSLIPINEATYTQTQVKLQNILGIDFNVFLHSAYLSQKRTEDFLLSSPEDRREVLAKILNLSVYDRINELAKEKRKEIKVLLDIKNREIDEENKILSEEESIKSLVADLEKKRITIEAELNGLRNRLNAFISQRSEIEQKLDILNQKKNEMIELQRKADEIRYKFDAARKELLKIEEKLKEEDKITAMVKEYEMIKEKVELKRKDYEKYLELKNKMVLCERDIKNKIDQKKIFEKNIEESNLQLNKETSEISKYEEEMKKVEVEISKVENELGKVKQYKQEQEKKREEIVKHEKLLEVVENKLKELASSYRLIEANQGRCPVCLRQINGQEEKEHIKNEIAAQGKEFKQRRDSLTKKLEILRKEFSELEEKIKNEEILRTREKKLHGMLENLKAKIDQKTQNISNLQNSIVQVTQSIKFCEEEIERLKEEMTYLKREISILSFDENYYTQLLQREKELEIYQRLFSELTVNKVKAENLKKGILEYQEQEKEILKKVEDLKHEIANLSTFAHAVMLEKVKSDILTCESKIKNLQESLNSVLKELGILEQKLNQIEEAKEKLSRLESEIEEMKKKIEIYDIIIDITGPDGIKNEIIANTLPQIRDEANKFLKILTNGAFSIDFKTQRETTSGKTIETLQIEISDASGTRNYELFSGGELFRINFAIRIALSKVLLKRSGASIRMLILDEGFGSQDEEGKDHIVECLNRIKDQFDTILVITHIEDLMDAFDQKIIVKKDMEGSKIFVV